jgi:hypothetical protein
MGLSAYKSWTLMEWNARLMGMDTSSANYTLETLRNLEGSKKDRLLFDRSIAQVCGKRVPDQTAKCEPNGFSMDGIHWCMESVGGRFVAAISCLLGCVYNQNNESSTTIEACERSCNEQFMSLKSMRRGNAARGSLHSRCKML